MPISRAAARGETNAAIFERATILSRTRAPFDTSSLLPGVTNRLSISLDGGISSALVQVPVTGTLVLEDLINVINDAFVGVGTVALPYRGHYLRLQSPRLGRGSQIDITASDAPCLALFDFNKHDQTGRSVEPSPFLDGIEENPRGSTLLGRREEWTQASVNRALSALHGGLDVVAGYVRADEPVPLTVILDPSELRTMDDLGAPKTMIFEDPDEIAVVGEVVTGVLSTATATIVRSIRGRALVTTSGTPFTPGETLNGSVSGAAFATLDSVLTDDRIRAIASPAPTLLVGSAHWFTAGFTKAEALRTWMHIENADETPLDTSTDEGLLHPHPASISSSPVLHVCLGEPDDAFEPSNLYDHLGVERLATTPIDAWSFDWITPSALSGEERAGDFAIIEDSEDGALTLNNGTYRIERIEDGTLYIEPFLPTNDSSQDDTHGSELYKDVPTTFGAGAKVRVVSPSYLLDTTGRLDSSGDPTYPFLFLDPPVRLKPGIALRATVFHVQTRDVIKAARPFDRPSQGEQRKTDLHLVRDTLSSLVHGVAEQSTPLLSEIVRGGDTVPYLVQSSLVDRLSSEARMSLRRTASDALLHPQDDRHEREGVLALGTFPDESAGDVSDSRVRWRGFRRKVRNDIGLFLYATRTHTPVAGDRLTGNTSGALLEFHADQADPFVVGNQFTARIVGSTLPQNGETFTWASGTRSATNVRLHDLRGWRVCLPIEILASDIDADVQVGGTSITFTSTPADFDQIRIGDRFHVIDAARPWSSRIRAIVLSPPSLTLEHAFPRAPSAEQWRVSPEIAPCISVGGEEGHVQGNKDHLYLDIAAGEIAPALAGSAPGDRIRITDPLGPPGNGTGSFRPLRTHITMQSGDALVRLEPDAIAGLETAAAVSWAIENRQTRLHCEQDPSGVLVDNTGRSYFQPADACLWWIDGCAFWSCPITTRSTSGGLQLTGLTGKTLSLALCHNGEVVDEASHTFLSDPTSVDDLVSDLQAAFASLDWVDFGINSEGTKLYAYTTDIAASANPGLPAYPGLGSKVSLLWSGEAYRFLVSGVPVSQENTSQALQAEEIAEIACHATFGSERTPFVVGGLLHLCWTQAVIGDADDEATSLALLAPRTDVTIQTTSSVESATQQNLDRTRFQNTAALPPALALRHPQSSLTAERLMLAVEETNAGKTTAFLRASGSAAFTQTEGIIPPTDALLSDRYNMPGTRPPLLHLPHLPFGPSNLQGRQIAFRIQGHKAPQTVTYLFTTESDIDDVVTALQAFLDGIDYPYFRVSPDDQGFGLIVRFDEAGYAALVGSNGPSAAVCSIGIDPRYTTLSLPVERDHETFERTSPLLGTIRHHGQGEANTPRWASSTSTPHVAGSVGGVHVQTEQTRRIVCAESCEQHKDATTMVDGYPKIDRASTVVEERVGSLRPFLERGEAAPLDQAVGRGLLDHDALLYSIGTSDQDLLLYLAPDFDGTPLSDPIVGEEVVYTDGTPKSSTILSSRLVTSPFSYYRRDEIAGSTPTFSATRCRLWGVSHKAPRGGTLYEASTSGARLLYNPTILIVREIQNWPAWSVGEEINGSNADAVIAGAIPLGGNRAVLFVVESTAKWNTSTAYGVVDVTHYNSFEVDRPVTSTDHGTFTSLLESVVVLSSHVPSRSAPRPVAALSLRSFDNAEESEGRPLVFSFGDVGIPDRGQYRFLDRLPQTGVDGAFPSEMVYGFVVTGTLGANPTLNEIATSTSGKRARVQGYSATAWWLLPIDGVLTVEDGDWTGDDSGNSITAVTEVTALDSVLYAARVAPQGRPCTSTLLAEQGKEVTGVTSVTLPGQTWGMIAPTVLATTLGATLEEDTTPISLEQIVYKPNAVDVAEQADGESAYTRLTFHVPLPTGRVWIEGFGGVVFRDDHSEPTKPLHLTLSWVGGPKQSGRTSPYGAPPSGYMHRLEVHDTEDDYMRVDSAGGGMPGIVSTPYLPTWAAGSRWSPFLPFLLSSEDGALIVLYLDQISGTVPSVGQKVVLGLTALAVSNLGPVREGVVAYVESYGRADYVAGTITSPDSYAAQTNGLRVYVYVGKEEADDQGYPNLASGPSLYKQSPSDFYRTRHMLFDRGEWVTFVNLAGTRIGHGHVAHVERYAHPPSLRIQAFLLGKRLDPNQYRDAVASVFVRYRVDRLEVGWR